MAAQSLREQEVRDRFDPGKVWFEEYGKADRRRAELAGAYGYLASTVKQLAAGHITPDTALAMLAENDAAVWPERPVRIPAADDGER